MSYAIAAALQGAIYTHLRADAALGALVGDAIYDALPAGALPALYVLLGPEDVRDASDKTAAGADHALTISVYSSAAGFAAAKAAAGAICDALLAAQLTLARGHLVGLRFAKARAARNAGNDLRQIDLIFRARVGDDS